GTLFAAGGQGEVVVWQVEGYKEQARFLLDGLGHSLAFSPDGKRLLAVDARSKEPHAVCTFDTASGRELERVRFWRTVPGVLSPDGRLLAALDLPSKSTPKLRSLSFFDAGTGASLSSWSDQGQNRYTAPSFSPDGQRLAYCRNGVPQV